MSFQLTEGKRPDNESIFQQLDRLNQVLQGIAIDQSSEVSFYLTSASMDSQKTFSRFSEEIEENFIESKFYKGIEEFLLELDRASMVREDFRSEELRKTQENNTQMVFEVSFDELDQIISNLQLLKIQDKIRIQFSGHDLLFVLNKDKFELVDKSEISANFLIDSDEETSRLSPLPDFSYDLMNLMHEAFNDQLIPSTFPLTSIEIEGTNSLSIPKSKIQSMISDLEWKSFELTRLKSSYQSKQHQLLESLKDLHLIRASLRSKEVKLINQRTKFQKDVENLKHHKKIIEKLRIDSKTFLSFIESCNLPNRPPSHNARLTPLSKESPFSSTQAGDEVALLQEEIGKLEELQTSATSEVIQTKIDRLKTRQSNLRTLRAINASAQRSNLAAARLRPGQKSKKLQEVGLNTLNSSRSSIDKENKVCNSRDSHNALEGFESYVKLQESRLIEKEQELNQREASLNKSWLSTTSGQETVVLLMNEQRNLKMMRKNLQRQQKNLENEVFANIKKNEEFKTAEKKLAEIISGVFKFINEQDYIENRLQTFFEVVDRVISEHSRFLLNTRD